MTYPEFRSLPEFSREPLAVLKKEGKYTKCQPPHNTSQLAHSTLKFKITSENKVADKEFFISDN